MLHCKERHKGNAHKPGGLLRGGRYFFGGFHRNMARQLAENPALTDALPNLILLRGVSHSLARDTR